MQQKECILREKHLEQCFSSSATLKSVDFNSQNSLTSLGIDVHTFRTGKVEKHRIKMIAF